MVKATATGPSKLIINAGHTPPTTALSYQPDEAAKARRGYLIKQAFRYLLWREKQNTSLSLGSESHAPLSITSLLDPEKTPTFAQQYQKKPLRIVFTDIDGCTRRGQMWIGWLVLDVLRFFPYNTVGLNPWGMIKLIVVVFIATGMRIQDASTGKINKERALNLFKWVAPDIDIKKVHESLDRYYQVYGKRNVSELMRRRIAYHVSRGELILGVSGSAERHARLHFQHLGLPETNAIGSDIEALDGKPTSKVTLCRDEKKVELRENRFLKPLREAGIPFTIVADYSDSLSDQPSFEATLEAGGDVFAVNASSALNRFVFQGRRGMILYEDIAKFKDGVAHTIVEKTEGHAIHLEEPIPPAPPFWVGDLGYYLRHSLQVGALLVLPTLASFSLPLLSTAAQESESASTLSEVAMKSALATLKGGVGAAVGHWFVPKPGSPVTAYTSTFWGKSWIWFMTETVPLAGALTVMNSEAPLSWILANSLALTGLSSLASKSFASIGHGVGWSGAERIAEGKLGQMSERFLQLLGYTASKIFLGY